MKKLRHEKTAPSDDAKAIICQGQAQRHQQLGLRAKTTPFGVAEGIAQQETGETGYLKISKIHIRQ